MLNPLETGRDLVARLRPRRGGRAAPGSPRIAILGNCQASAIARAVRLLRPDAEVRFFSAGALGRRQRRPEDMVRTLRGFDLIFAQQIASGHVGPGHYAALAAECPGYGVVPAIVFAAFHPDLVYVGGPGTPHPDFVNSPVGHYNSAIVLYAYLAGFSAEQTLRLFSREILEQLGYLDLWGYAQDTLLSIGRDAGLDLAAPLLRWARRGCFMHSVNHPKMHVAADLARLLLDRAGIPFADYDLDGFLIDDLSLKGLWPVYEAVGQHYGVPGCFMFQAQTLRRSAGPGRVFTLPDFVAGSFAAYRGHARSDLVCDRVEAWLASEPLGAAFRRWAA